MKKFIRPTNIIWVMTAGYVLAMACIALLSFGAYFVQIDTIGNAESNASVINISGRQRMLSQRIALLAMKLEKDLSPAEKERTMGEMRAEIDLMRQSHEGLIKGSAEMNLPGILSPEMRSIYFEKPILLHDKIKKYLFEADKLVAEVKAGAIEGHEHSHEDIVKIAGELLVALDFVVLQQELESESGVRKIKRLQAQVFAATLITVLLMALFIFIPMGRNVSGKTKDLQKAEKDIRAILSTVGEGIISVDSSSSIRMVNSELCDIFGYEEEELIGRNVTMIMPESYRSKHESGMQRYLKEGHSRIINHRMELEGIRKDGSVFPLELRIEETVVEGEKLFTAAIRDISLRKKIIGELEESEKKYRKLIESAGDAIVVIDKETETITDLNIKATELLGMAKEEVKGRHFTIMHPERLIDEYKQRFAMHASGLRSLENEIVVKHSDGHEILVSITTSVAEIGGRIIIQGILKDITERKRAESALQESEEKYRNLVDNAVVGVFQTEIGGEIVYANDALVKMLEYESLEEAVSTSALAKYKNPKDREKLIEALKERGSVSGFQIEVVTKTGKIKNVLLSATLYGSRLSGIISDITELKAAQEALEGSEAKSRAILDTAADGIISIDSAGIIEVFNKGAEKIFGYASEEVIGRNIKVIMPEPYKSEHDGYIGEYLRTGEGKVVGLWRELSGMRKDGTIFPIELSVAEFSAGERRMFTGVVRDITERKEIERHLSNAKGKYEALIDHTTNAIYTLSERGELTFVSKSIKEMTGVGYMTIIQFPNMWDGLVVKEDFDKFRNYRKAMLQKKSPTSVQYRILKNDGSIVFVHDKCSPILDEEGNVLHFHCSLEDITKLKELDKIKEDFMQMVVHDLKSPITGIRLELETIEQNLGHMQDCAKDNAVKMLQSTYADSIKTKLQNTREGIENIFQMIQSLLKLGEIEGENINLRYSLFDIKEVFEDITLKFEERLKRKGLKLEINNEVDEMLISDRNILTRVLQNLLDNAIKFSFAFKRIEITAQSFKIEDDVFIIRISTTNTCKQVPAHEINSLFSKYRTSYKRRSNNVPLRRSFSADMAA